MVSVSGVRRLSVPLFSGSDVMNDRPVFVLAYFVVLSAVRTCGYINTADGCVVHHISF